MPTYVNGRPFEIIHDPTKKVYVDKYSLMMVEEGSSDHPFKTLQTAVDYVTLYSTNVNPYVIEVGPGVYSESILIRGNGAFFEIHGSGKYNTEIYAPSGPAICTTNATEASVIAYHASGNYTDLQPETPPIAGPSYVKLSNLKLKSVSSNTWAAVETLGVKGDQTADTTNFHGLYGIVIEECLIQLSAVGTYRYAYFRNTVLVQLIGTGTGNGGSNSYVEFFNSAYVTIQRDIPRVKATYDVTDPNGRSRYDRCEVTAKNCIISQKHECFGAAKFDVWGASSPYAGSADITMNDTSQLRLFGTALYGALYINDLAIATLLGTAVFSNVTLEALASLTATASHIAGNLTAPAGAGVVVLKSSSVSGTISDPGNKITTGLERHGRFAFTELGGHAISLINKTGAPSVKGTVVKAGGAVDEAFILAPADSDSPIGIVYEAGVADGQRCLVVVTGIADALLEDGTAAVYPGWVRVSATVAGRVTADMADPPGGTITALEDHMKEAGHTLKAVIAGVNQLVRMVVHKN